MFSVNLIFFNVAANLLQNLDESSFRSLEIYFLHAFSGVIIESSDDNCLLLVSFHQLVIELKGKNSANFAARGFTHSVLVRLVNFIITFWTGISTNEQNEDNQK